MDKEYFDRDYFDGSGVEAKSGYIKDSFRKDNDVFSHQANMIFDTLKLDNKVVVDLGCAKNNLVMWLRKLGANAYGQDISKWCHENSYVPDYHKLGDISKGILFDDNSVDAIVSFEVFEHIGGVDNLLSNMKRVLKPNGYLFATISSDGHSKDVSAVTLKDRGWWEKRFAEFFVKQDNLIKEFNSLYLIKTYCWKVYCYRNTV